VGREAGITEEQLREMTAYEQSTAFSPLEKLVIEYAVEMTKTPVEVPNTLLPRFGSTSTRHSSSS
jgi:hypothetical protein